jgi:hypothetical protein
VNAPDVDHSLVERLVRDVRPVRALRPRRLLLVWLALQATVLAALAVHALRPDIGAVLHRPLFVAQALALTVSGAVAAWLAVRSAFPDRAPGPRSVGLAGALGVFGLTPSAASGPHVGGSFVAMGLPCSTMTVALASLPWVALLLLVGRGASVVPARAGLLAGAAAFLLAAAGMRAVCSLDDPLHLLAWHGGPVALGAAVSCLVGAAFLGRWAASCAASRSR